MRLIVCALAVFAVAALAVVRLFFDGSSVPAARATPSAPRPIGAVAFSGNFETGNVSQWTWGAQCANTGVPSTPTAVTGTVSVQSRIVGQGHYAAQFDLPASQASNSCEALAKRQIGLGTDDYYGLMVRFPSDWREPSPAAWGLSIAQFNFESISGPPVALIAHADHVSLVLQTGLCRTVGTSAAGCAYSNGAGGNVAPLLAVPAPLALGVWHELIVHVHWAADSSGLVAVWHRLQGGASWKRTAYLHGLPTVQWTSAGPASLKDGTTSDKVGAYRGYADFPISIWLDGFVRATSFAAAAAALP